MNPKSSRFVLLATTAIASFSSMAAVETTPVVDTWSASSIEASGITAFSADQSFTIENSGGAIFGSADAFEFIHTDLINADGEIIVQIGDFVTADGAALDANAAVGLMFRESTAPDARYGAILLKGNGDIRYSYRTAVGANTRYQTKSGLDYTWFRLQAEGTRYTAYGSTDGQTWTRIDAATLDLGESPLMGAFVVSGDSNSVSATLSNLQAYTPKDQDEDGLPDYEETTLYNTSVTSADTDNDGLSDAREIELGTNALVADSDGDGLTDGEEVELKTNPLVDNGQMLAGWEMIKVGNASAESVATYDETTGKFFITSTSGDVWGSSDNFTAAVTEITGDTVFVCKVDSLQHAQRWTKSGIMIRESLDANSKHAFMMISGSSGSALQWRSQTGANSASLIKSGNAPYWVALVREGNTFTGYAAEDGPVQHWMKVGETTIEMAETVKAAVLLTSNSTNTASTAISNVSFESAGDMDSDGIIDWVESEVVRTDEFRESTDLTEGTDLEELNAGTHPNHPALVIDGKTYHSRGLVAKYFKNIFRLQDDYTAVPIYDANSQTDLFYPSTWGRIAGGSISNGVALFNGKIYIPSDGEYTFSTMSDDGAAITIGGETVFRETTAHSMRETSGSITLTAGYHDLQLEYYDVGGPGGLKVYWQGPGIEKQILPAANLLFAADDLTAATNAIDTDLDGLTDLQEAELGTDPNNTDSDGDGLSDFIENSLGLNPLAVDTDGDGIDDYTEHQLLKTDALLADFNGEKVLYQELPVHSFFDHTGEWLVNEEESSVTSQSVRGELAYDLETTVSEPMLLEIDWSTNNEFTTEFSIWVGERFISSHEITLNQTQKTLKVILPALPIGKDKLRILWNNLKRFDSVTMHSMTIYRLDGPDVDGDGTKDWFQNSIKNYCIAELPLQSFISPVSIQGSSLGLDGVTVDGLPVTENGRGLWFETVHLDQHSEVTAYPVAHVYGKHVSQKHTAWSALEVGKKQTLVLEKGDTLRMAINKHGFSTGEFSATMNGNVIDLAGVDVWSYTFDAVGEYQFTSEFTALSGDAFLDEMVVTVKEPIPDNTNAYLTVAGVSRTIALPWLHNDLVFVFPDSLDGSLDYSNKQLTILSEYIGKQAIFVKSKSTQRILGSIPVQTVALYGAGESSLYLAGQTEGASLINMDLIMYPLIPDAKVKLSIFLPGVIFNDYSVDQWVASDQFAANGLHTVTFLKTSEATKTATCHHVYLYNGEQEVGRKY